MEHNSPTMTMQETSAATSGAPTTRSSLEINSHQNPFATGSANTAQTSRATSFQGPRPTQKYFRSRRVAKGDYPKPWLTQKKDPREKWTCIIPMIGIALGLCVVGGLIYLGISGIQPQSYCPVLDDDFSGGLNSKVWTKEVEVDGFGNGQFEQTTNTDENAFVQDGMLVIKPTLQDANLINTNNILDLRNQGCTGGSYSACVAVTNTTNGTIVPPVKSARINTKAGATIKYGKVEVVAQMPAGDWMWPAIWMLPVNNTYGEWPASGEIDIAESRGNNYSYPGGNDIITSTLHLGPTTDEDSYFRYIGAKTALHSTFPQKFHTFGLEWNDKYLFMYLDGKAQDVLYVKFNSPFWQRNEYPVASPNGTDLVDIWGYTGRDSTPFDQDFYLILNVAVGKAMYPNKSKGTSFNIFD